MATALFVAKLAYAQDTAATAWPDERMCGPFVCHADFPLRKCSSLLEEMSQLQTDLVHTLALRPATETVHLFLFDREQVYREYIAQYFPNVPYRRALFIKQQGPGMIFAYTSRELDVDLRHETTHALLHAALPMVPLWLDEGLAEYFELAAADRAHRHPHLPKLKWGMVVGGVPSLERLERIAKLEEMGITEYRESWAWVHFMLHGPPAAKEELTDYLSDVQAHVPPGDLSQRLRRRMPDLERLFRGHFKQWTR